MKKPRLPCFVLMLLLAGFSLPAEEIIALHPFKGEPKEIADEFFDVLFNELLHVPVQYIAFPISLDDLPPDIPPGGFPANICPSPEITHDASYTITGEFYADLDYADSYRVRLYLWDMALRRLLIMDELTAADRETCEYRMPYMLNWLLSWIDRDKLAAPDPGVEERSWVLGEAAAPPEPPPAAPWDSSRWAYIGPKGGEGTTALDNPDQWVYLGPEPEKWLHLGLRGGAGYSQWFYKPDPGRAPGSRDTANFWNANAALQAAFHITRFLDIQTEVNVASDFGSVANIIDGSAEGNGTAFAWSLTVPLLLRLGLRGSHLKAGVFGGAHLYLPLGTTNGDSLGDYFDYRPDQPGFTFGLNIGWKLGPGYLFLDGRFEYDGNWYNKDKGPVYYRNSIKVNTGYEFGLFNKK